MQNKRGIVTKGTRVFLFRPFRFIFYLSLPLSRQPPISTTRAFSWQEECLVSCAGFACPYDPCLLQSLPLPPAPWGRVGRQLHPRTSGLGTLPGSGPRARAWESGGTPTPIPVLSVTHSGQVLPCRAPHMENRAQLCFSRFPSIQVPSAERQRECPRLVGISTGRIIFRGMGCIYIFLSSFLLSLLCLF